MQFTRNDPSLKEKRRDLRKNQTDAEKLLWARLRNKQLLGNKFYRQYSVGAYILDFYCPDHRLAIELDGGQHAAEEKQMYDEVRSAFLKSEGIAVVRFWNNDVMQNLNGVLLRIAECITPPNLPLH